MHLPCTCKYNVYIIVAHQGSPPLAQIAGIAVPRMLPTEVCEFHIPITRPRLLIPSQLPITATTPGQPVLWRRSEGIVTLILIV